MNAPLFTPHRPRVSGAIAHLTFALAEHARRLGLTVVFIRASRMGCSATKHLQIRDAQGRDWLLRVSNHKNPGDTGYEDPHFDLVTVDGSVGAELAFGWLQRMSRGEIAWTAPERSHPRKGRVVRGQKGRRR